MNEEEIKRQATYNYFNQRYRKSNEENMEKKKPLYKAVPELFFGIFLVFLYILEWAHASYQKSRQNIVSNTGKGHEKTLRQMNFRGRYEKPPPL